MNHWHFILGAYAVTALALILEIVAVRRRSRVARDVAASTAAPPPITGGARRRQP
jgi:heme exporter protein D